MRPVTLITCLWPGLAPAWWRGRWQGLLEAAAFALLFNFLLTVTFVWPETLVAPWPTVMWLALGAFWTHACWRAWEQWPSLVDSRPSKAQEALFRRAQNEYLKGHWYDAEKLVQQLLATRPRDVEGHLLLASLFRHSHRLDQAEQQLQILERLDGASRWSSEIMQERRQVERLARNEASRATAGQMDEASEEPDAGMARAA